MQENMLIRHAKFVTKELLVVLELIEEKDYDEELRNSLGELTKKLIE